MSKKILIVAPVACYPAYSGNAARIAAIYELLASKGFEVSYLHMPEHDTELSPEMISVFRHSYFWRPYQFINSGKIRRVLKAIKTVVLKKSSRKLKIDDFISKRDVTVYENVLKLVDPDIVWINYTFYSKLFEYTPASVHKVLDTHDSVYLRYNKQFNKIDSYKNLEFGLVDEINCIDRADDVICIQNIEEAFFRESGSSKRLRTIGHIHPFTATVVRKQKNKLLFLANDHITYKTAITAFINKVWPLLKASKPDIHLFIAGRVCHKLNKETLDTNITLLGVVPDLKSLYDSIDLTINPVIPGSGLKIKNIESLCFGKPVITTTSGKEGLEMFENQGLIVADNPQEWVNNIPRLLTDADYYDSQIADLDLNIRKYNNSNIVQVEKLLGIQNLQINPVLNVV
jgi:glycosyltransferase involved in cell wall biosynthesis